MDKKYNSYRRQEDISFHFATSDRDLMEKVTQIMKRRGHVSFSDSMGIEHFLIDGRKGAHELVNKVEKVSEKLMAKTRDDRDKVRPYFAGSIEHAVEMAEIPSNLKGYHYIKFTLNRLIDDDSLITPLSKTVYPCICEIYNCNVSQVERDIRYAIKRSRFSKIEMGPKAFICTLLEYAKALSREMFERDTAASGDTVGYSGTDKINRKKEKTANRGNSDLYKGEFDRSRLDNLFKKAGKGKLARE